MKQDAVMVGTTQALATSDPESILRYAIEKNANVDVIERMMAVRDKLQSEFAKKQYDEALAAFQNECPIILKMKQGAKNAYQYAPFEDIIHQTKDLIRRHGFSYRITSETKDNMLKAICKITHSAGHSETSEFEVPIDNKNPMMSDPQRFGGARTFASRYAFCGGFGIVTMDSDMDGRMEKSKARGPSIPEPLRELAALVRPEITTFPALNKWLSHNNLIADGEDIRTYEDEKVAEVLTAARKIKEATK